VVLAVAHPNPWASASFYLPSQSLSGALSYSKTEFVCMNLTKREATCISPTLNPFPLFQPRELAHGTGFHESLIPYG